MGNASALDRMPHRGPRRDPVAGGGVQSVDRAITVPEILARRGEAGVSEVATEIDVHKSTALRGGSDSRLAQVLLAGAAEISRCLGFDEGSYRRN